jgi:hypothetical protein
MLDRSISSSCVDLVCSTCKNGWQEAELPPFFGWVVASEQTPWGFQAQAFWRPTSQQFAAVKVSTRRAGLWDDVAGDVFEMVLYRFNQIRDKILGGGGGSSHSPAYLVETLSGANCWGWVPRCSFQLTIHVFGLGWLLITGTPARVP